MPPKTPRSRRRPGDRPQPTTPPLKDRLVGALILFVLAEIAMAIAWFRASRRSDMSVDFWIAGAVICGLAGADFQERQCRRRGD
jgi:hypothetical protein